MIPQSGLATTFAGYAPACSFTFGQGDDNPRSARNLNPTAPKQDQGVVLASRRDNVKVGVKEHSSPRRVPIFDGPRLPVSCYWMGDGGYIR